LRDTQAGSVLAVIAPGAEVSPDLQRAVHNQFVILEFPEDKTFVQRISVPAQARKFLAGVISNQIERLSPWPARDVVYGYAADAGAAEAAAVEVRIVMAARSDVEAARQDLATLGLAVDRVAARDPDSDARDGSAASVTLWSRLADRS